MKEFLTNKKMWWGGAIILVVLGALLMGRTGDKTSPNTFTVKNTDILQEVSVTGKVKPVSVVDLGFEKSGRIEGVYAKIGEHVNKGSLLSELESLSAQANFLEADAELKELRRGPRPEEIAVKEAEEVVPMFTPTTRIIRENSEMFDKLMAV